MGVSSRMGRYSRPQRVQEVAIRGLRQRCRLSGFFGLWAVLAGLMVQSCSSDSTDGSQQVDLESSALASLDVRGGAVEQIKQLSTENEASGQAGNGGVIRVTSQVGNLTMTSGDPGLTPVLPLIAGLGLDVLPGAPVSVNGLQIVDFLRVRPGAQLLLSAGTLFQVTGDVDISGEILVVSGAGDADGHDLTIIAGGIVNISGSINLRGRSNEESTDGLFLSGGNGGRVSISAGGNTTSPTGPHLFVSGLINCSGGDATELFNILASARAGQGGEVFLGSGGSIAITGKLLARGGLMSMGEQDLNIDGTAANGGSIELVATADIIIGEAIELSASGGDTVGIISGAAGRVSLEAPLGTLGVDGVDLTCRGGNLLKASASLAGFGGTVDLYGSALDLTDSLLNSNGGTVGVLDTIKNFPVEGIGGNGGSVQLTASTGLVVSNSVVIHSLGGDSKQPGTGGGVGGDVLVINLDSTNVDVVDFNGFIEVTGGLDPLHQREEAGTICQRGAGGDSVARMTNNNRFPIATCPVSGAGEIEGLDIVIRDMDCDDDSLFPGLVRGRVPVNGADFFRVRPGNATSITITLIGEAGGDLDLYAGEDMAIGSRAPGDYAFSSTTPDTSGESVTIDLTGFTPGQFIAVFIDERTNFVENFTITITCELPVAP